MAMTVKKAFLTNDSRLRLWTGVPVGIGLRLATTSIVGTVTGLDSAWLKPIPCTLPVLAVGALLCAPKVTRRAGLGVMLGALVSYVYTAVQNMGVEKAVASLKDQGVLSGLITMHQLRGYDGRFTVTPFHGAAAPVQILGAAPMQRN